eukprot:196139_1
MNTKKKKSSIPHGNGTNSNIEMNNKSNPNGHGTNSNTDNGGTIPESKSDTPISSVNGTKDSTTQHPPQLSSTPTDTVQQMAQHGDNTIESEIEEKELVAFHVITPEQL